MSPVKTMLQKRVAAIRAESDTEEEFQFALKVMLNDLAIELGALMAEHAEARCPYHGIGLFTISLGLGARAALQELPEPDAGLPPPVPMKQAVLALVPAAPAVKCITPAEIQPLRRAKKLSQREVGEVVGLSQATIGRWENDQGFEPNVRQLTAIQNLLGWTG